MCFADQRWRSELQDFYVVGNGNTRSNAAKTLEKRCRNDKKWLCTDARPGPKAKIWPSLVKLCPKIHDELSYIVLLSAEFVWRLDEMRWNGTIVVVAHGSQPLRWSYLADGVTPLDAESGSAQSYRWYKSVDCHATIMKDRKIIDRSRFAVVPAAQSNGC